jgi:hypothetical protein
MFRSLRTGSGLALSRWGTLAPPARRPQVRSQWPAPALDHPPTSPVRESADLSRMRGRWVTDAAGRLIMIWEVAGAAPAGVGVPAPREA